MIIKHVAYWHKADTATRLAGDGLSAYDQSGHDANCRQLILSNVRQRPTLVKDRLFRAIEAKPRVPIGMEANFTPHQGRTGKIAVANALERWKHDR